MTVNPPAMPIPSRVLELEARFGARQVTLGNEADAFAFGQRLEAASLSDSGPVNASIPVVPGQVTPGHTGRVVNDDGTLGAKEPAFEVTRGVPDGLVVSEDGASNAPFITSRASPMCCIRSRTFLVRRRRSNSRIGSGVRVGSADQSGSSLMIDARVSETSSPANARFADSIS